jgi:hypothetical protein
MSAWADRSTNGSRNACDTCRFATFDMDGSYCASPKSFEISPTFGASLNRMSLEGYCAGGWDDEAKNTRKLWEPKTQ